MRTAELPKRLRNRLKDLIRSPADAPNIVVRGRVVSELHGMLIIVLATCAVLGMRANPFTDTTSHPRLLEMRRRGLGLSKFVAPMQVVFVRTDHRYSSPHVGVG